MFYELLCVCHVLLEIHGLLKYIEETTFLNSRYFWYSVVSQRKKKGNQVYKVFLYGLTNKKNKGAEALVSWISSNMYFLVINYITQACIKKL